MPINPFQKSSGNPSGITTFGGVREQDVFNQFYPRTLGANPAAAAVSTAISQTPPVGSTTSAPAQTTPAAQGSMEPFVGTYAWMQRNIAAANPSAQTPVSRVTDLTGPTAEQIAARDAVRADLARRRKDYEASLPQSGPAPTKPPTQSDWWMSLLYNNPDSFRNTIIGMSGRAQPYGGPAYGDTSGFGGGFSAAQPALDEYSRLYGRAPTDFTEEELTRLATQGGLGGYAFGTAGMRGG